MRKLFIILVGLIAIVTFIRAFDNNDGLSMEISSEVSQEADSEVFSQEP